MKHQRQVDSERRLSRYEARPTGRVRRSRVAVLIDTRVAAQYACPDQARFWDPDKCTAFLEQKVLTRFPGLFAREGKRLTVTFANGKKQVFVSGEREKDREAS